VIFYGLCWLPWNGRQAVLFDLVERKFYIFGLVFWPQDVILPGDPADHLGLFALFLFTAVGGSPVVRLCLSADGLYGDLHVDRTENRGRAQCRAMKLDAAPMSARKLWLRSAPSSAVWGCCVVDRIHLRRLLHSDPDLVGSSLWSFSLGPWETFWMLFYGLYLPVRRDTCASRCASTCAPYARFQGVMFDPDTLIITYDAERGEPRGARKEGPIRRRLPRATASTAASACRSARPASTSARDCSTNASAVPPASTPATRSWTRWPIRAA
jgi:polyferredoxin